MVVAERNLNIGGICSGYLPPNEFKAEFKPNLTWFRAVIFWFVCLCEEERKTRTIGTGGGEKKPKARLDLSRIALEYDESAR
jgi:hypothetical protein